jgi:DNA-binding transcriptional MerR regulator
VIRPVAPEDELLTPAEAAAELHVDPSRLNNWARAGRYFRPGEITATLGGHRRYKRAAVERVRVQRQSRDAA